MTNHAQLQQLISKFTKKQLPIINSEWGQTDVAKGMNKVIIILSFINRIQLNNL